MNITLNKNFKASLRFVFFIATPLSLVNSCIANWNRIFIHLDKQFYVDLSDFFHTGNLLRFDHKVVRQEKINEKQ